MKSFSKGGQECNEEDCRCPFFKCRYPVFTGGKRVSGINTVIESYIIDSTCSNAGVQKSRESSIESMAESFFRDYEIFRTENAMQIPFRYDLSGDVLLNGEGVLSVDISHTSYTGGAHGMTFTRFFVFDARTGSRLQPGDIFVNGFEQELNTLIDRKYRELKGLSPTERLDSERGGLFADCISFNDNFALTGIGIMFFYNSYEIAPYVQGPTEILLRYREIDAILKPEYRQKARNFFRENDVRRKTTASLHRSAEHLRALNRPESFKACAERPVSTSIEPGLRGHR